MSARASAHRASGTRGNGVWHKLEQQALAAITADLGAAPKSITPDGKTRRFSTNGTGDDAGYVRAVNIGGTPTVFFGCYRQGVHKEFTGDAGRRLTAAERKAQEEKRRAVQAEIDAEDAKRHARAAAKAREIWASVPWAGDNHPYLEAKQIDGAGLGLRKGFASDELVVPIMDVTTDEIISLQFINETPYTNGGNKKYLRGGRTTGGVFRIGQFAGAKTILVCEGPATGLSLHKASSLPVVCAMCCGNLKAVATALRKRYPDARLLIVADNDTKTKGNPGVTKAREAAKAAGATLAIPDSIAGSAADANDIHVVLGLDALADWLEGELGAVAAQLQAAPITPERWEAARTAPDPIVEDYLYPDVAVLAGAGGVSKTTLTVFESIKIILGIPLFDYGVPDTAEFKVVRPGPVVFVTKEDPAELMIARAREIAKDLHLSDQQIKQVQKRLHIFELNGENFRLTTILDDMVAIDLERVDALIEALRPLHPVLVNFDPLVSFGSGELRVNDGMSGLVEAGRRIARSLNCCVRFIHHVGKENGRDGTTDQYSPRGGSALSDGCRMVATLINVNSDEWLKRHGLTLPSPDDCGLVLTVAKLTYKKRPAPILLEREHFCFKAVVADPLDADDKLRLDADRVVATIRTLNRPTQNAVKLKIEGVSKTRAREIMLELERVDALAYVEDNQSGGAQKYLTINEGALMRWRENLTPAKHLHKNGRKKAPRRKF
jgi:phage/plasmid primase-like uncharacterized protein